MPKDLIPEMHSDFEASHGIVALASNSIPFVLHHYDAKSDGFLAPRELERQFDDCAGHGDDEGHYHYHFAPTCLLRSLGSAVPATDTWWHSNDTAKHWPTDGHPVRVGTTLDGFPLFGPYHPVDGSRLRSHAGAESPLDKCHGMHMPDGEYGYFLTVDAPFLPPCLQHRLGAFTG